MYFALFPNEKKKQSFEIAREIGVFLKKQGISIAAEEEKAQRIEAEPFSTIDMRKIKYLISMGGDGTLLRIAHQYHYLDAPILGINLGHLGFMADVPVDDIFPSLNDLIEGKYVILKRPVLEAKHQEMTLYAVNDIVLHRAHNYSLIE